VSQADWCREEVLRARRVDGVGEVLPMGRRAEIGSVVFAGLALLLLLSLSLRTPDATFFAGTVIGSQAVASEGFAVALAERCELAASTLRPEMAIEIRRRTAFGAWRQATVRRAPACAAGGLLTLQLAPGAPEITPGAALLVRVASGSRTLYSRLGELRRPAPPPSKGTE
jgi:hypothetical protein